MFAEEAGLIKYMQDNGVCIEISVIDYETGNWAMGVNEAYDTQKRMTYRETIEGSSRVVDIVRSLAIRGRAY